MFFLINTNNKSQKKSKGYSSKNQSNKKGVIMNQYPQEMCNSTLSLFRYLLGSLYLISFGGSTRKRTVSERQLLD